jgi:subtilisin family serine protease
VHFSVAAVLVLLTGSAWSTPGSITSTGFAPDEILVKFRRPEPGTGKAVEGVPFDKSRLLRDLGTPGGRLRVREVRPIVRDFDRGQEEMRSLRDMDPARLTPRQKRLLARQKRAPATGRRPDLGNIYRVPVDLAAGESLGQVLAAYRSRPDVEYAEPNPIIFIAATPDDPFYPDQWALGKIHAAEAWDICRGSSDVLVAVIDTGVDYNHPDLRANLWTNEAEQNGLPGIDDDKNGYVDDIRGYNFAAGTNDPIDDHGHGTAITGIIAAVGNNGTDIAGLCWTVRIMPLKVLTATGNGTAADAVPATYYAVANGADIIAGSWGGTEASNTLRDAVAYAYQEGVVIVAAAGNSGSNAAYYPAVYPEVIAVAATESNDNRWYLSNYGDWVDLAAPGRDIASLRATLPGQAPRPGSIVRMSGTSLAAPHVSGTCALLLAVNPYLRCEELQQILRATGDPIAPGTCSSNGRLNVYQALRAAIPPAGTIRMDRVYYAEGAEIGLLLADWHLRGAGLSTALVETSGGDQEIVILKESDVSAGILRATIASRNAAVVVGDGILQVRDGEGIQARYLDADDGHGHLGEWRSASAVTDYRAPTIVGLEIKPQNVTAMVEFRTSEPTWAEVRYSEAGGPYVTQRDFGFSDHHTIELHGLDVQTRYRVIVAVKDEADNMTVADNNGPGYAFVTTP